MAGSKITFVGGDSIYVEEDPKRVSSYLKPDTSCELTRDGEKVLVFGANVLYVEPQPEFGGASF
jgi:hypothetical protein